MSHVPGVPSSLKPTGAGETGAEAPDAGLAGDLLAVVGHELRNPLHALTLQLSLARAAAASDPGSDAVARIEKAQRMLARYVGRVTVLFDLMRSSDAEVAVHPQQTDLAALLVSIADGLAAEAQFRRAALQVEMPADGCMAVLDPHLVEQMVDNLLINAFKHADARQVTLKLSTTTTTPGSGRRVRIEVADDGRGVPADEQPHLFGRPVIGQNSTRGAGTGLGLWIVRRLASALGGSVALRDGPAGGAVFSLDLPCAPASPSASSPVQPAPHPSASSTTDP